jgi:hypothetical protein
MSRTRAFVGRADELGRLENALVDARRGDGRFVLVTGTPGIGKTRLVDELVSRAGDDGLQIGIGRAWEGAGAPAWWIWREALRPLGVDLTFPSTLANDESRFACLELVAEAVRDLAEAAPLVLVLDDLQWADVSSLLAASSSHGRSRAPRSFSSAPCVIPLRAEAIPTRCSPTYAGRPRRSGWRRSAARRLQP